MIHLQVVLKGHVKDNVVLKVTFKTQCLSVGASLINLLLKMYETKVMHMSVLGFLFIFGTIATIKPVKHLTILNLRRVGASLVKFNYFDQNLENEVFAYFCKTITFFIRLSRYSIYVTIILNWHTRFILLAYRLSIRKFYIFRSRRKI